ncbi:MAG: RES family NAD+ phosphorylase [Candidatus Binatia bacterium]
MYRVGRSPDPLAWPPATVTGRYNDPQGRFSVLYAASQRRAAFMETLQNFRPALGDLAILKSLPPSEELDLPFPIGHVPASYFGKLLAAFHLDRSHKWLDLRSLQTHAHLRETLAAELVEAGYAGAFNFGEMIGSDNRITQLIARWAHDAGYGGVAYPSAHDGKLTCWAIFNRAPVIPAGYPEPIRRDDPDLIAAIDLFGLKLP